MPYVRTKICGITSIQDAQAAVHFGADALGFVFYPSSPRYIHPSDAAAIIHKLPPFVTCVGLFVNAEHEMLKKTVSDTGVDLVQFHGDESEHECGLSSKPWIKAIRVGEETDLAAEAKRYNGANSLLLDTMVRGSYGGTGKTFDWSLVPKNIDKPIILAGGLDLENVIGAINVTLPYAVDVSGGVELKKGVKDHAKMEEFIKRVRSIEK
ncbi:MAG: phosphoribosylanthranilate isomerase [Gammaproteobacteria bacterium]